MKTEQEIQNEITRLDQLAEIAMEAADVFPSSPTLVDDAHDSKIAWT